MKKPAFTVLVVGIIILITVALGNITTPPQPNPEPSPESVFGSLNQQLSSPQGGYYEPTPSPEFIAPMNQAITPEDCANLAEYCAEEASPEEQPICEKILSEPTCLGVTN